MTARQSAAVDNPNLRPWECSCGVTNIAISKKCGVCGKDAPNPLIEMELHREYLRQKMSGITTYHTGEVRMSARQSSAVDKALRLISKGLTPYAAAKKTGIALSTIYRAVKRIKGTV
jgi:hypothetical protein